MAHVVTEACIKCKFTDCVDVCPVSCFYEGELMLYINPDECIDCGVCIPECPIEAIESESSENLKWQELNSEYSKKSPRIESSKKPLPEAENYRNETGKFEKYFKLGG